MSHKRDPLKQQTAARGGWRQSTLLRKVMDAVLFLKEDDTIEGVPTFANDGVPFALGANAKGQQVTGLNAEQLQGRTPGATGGVATLSGGYLDRSQIATAENHELIRSASELPGTQNGRHQLSDNTVYVFSQIVSSQYGLELGDNTPLIAPFGSIGGFICTGGGPAFYGRGVPFFCRDFYGHAPGGQLFDLQANSTTEFLAYDSSFADAAALGNISNLGMIDGFRVPSLKGVNLEDFDAGLTFTGSPDKIFLSGTPMRGITASSVTILTFAGGLSAGIVDITGCYVKGVQSDTKVVDVKSGALPSEIFQYRGTTHDSTVTKSNILNGEVGVDKVGTKVVGSAPLADSDVVAQLDLDASTTVTGSGGAPTEVPGAGTLTRSARTSNPTDSRIQYDARFDETIRVTASAAVSGSNTEFALAVGKNGSELPDTRMTGYLPNNSNAQTVTVGTRVDMTQGDTVQVFLENVGGADDLSVNSMTITI